MSWLKYSELFVINLPRGIMTRNNSVWFRVFSNCEIFYQSVLDMETVIESHLEEIQKGLIEINPCHSFILLVDVVFTQLTLVGSFRSAKSRIMIRFLSLIVQEEEVSFEHVPEGDDICLSLCHTQIWSPQSALYSRQKTWSCVGFHEGCQMKWSNW